MNRRSRSIIYIIGFILTIPFHTTGAVAGFKCFSVTIHPPPALDLSPEDAQTVCTAMAQQAVLKQAETYVLTLPVIKDDALDAK